MNKNAKQLITGNVVLWILAVLITRRLRPALAGLIDPGAREHRVGAVGLTEQAVAQLDHHRNGEGVPGGLAYGFRCRWGYRVPRHVEPVGPKASDV